MMNHSVVLETNNIKLSITDMSVSCYGAIGLMDFNYKFNLEILFNNGETLIKEGFEDDIAELIKFVDGYNEISSSKNNSTLIIGEDYSTTLSGLEPFMKIALTTTNLNFKVGIGYCRNEIQDFKLELKSVFEFLINEYIKQHPDANYSGDKITF